MYMIRRKPPDVSGAGLLLRGPPLSPGVVRGVGTTSRDPLPRAPLSVGASAAEWEILDGKRVDLQSGAPGQAGPGSGPCRARLGPVPGPARALCRARLATPGPKRPNQQVEERGGPGEEKTGPANRPARARLRHIGRPAHSQPGPGRRVCRARFARGGPGEEKTGPAKARSAARERPLLTRPGPAGAPAGPGTGPARARPTYVRGPSYIRRLPKTRYPPKTSTWICPRHITKETSPPAGA